MKRQSAERKTTGRAVIPTRATVLVVQAFQHAGDRGLLVGSAILVVIGVPLVVLAPAKQSVEQVSAAGA